MTDKNFFNESSEQSQVKAAIVAKYFRAWAKVVMPTAKLKNGVNRIAYIDIFAGPGRYKDGTKSTPIMVLEEALQDVEISQMLVTLFNDVNSDNTASLEVAVKAVAGYEKLKYKPKVYNYEVGTEITQMFNKLDDIPTLFFVDPWGYKGLSLELINSVLRNWGCDCIFFFNYNRINMGLNNVAVEQHMNALFGQARADELRLQLEPMKSSERELTIVDAIAQALKDMGGKYVLPFRFMSSKSERTSHHLIFVSKHFKGYHLMKRVMATQSSSAEQGVSSFDYNPATERQPLLNVFRERPISELKQVLLQEFTGQSIRMVDIYETHSIDTRYTDVNYKEALRQLEAEGLVSTDRPASKRRIIKGVVSFADDILVTFP